MKIESQHAGRGSGLDSAPSMAVTLVSLRLATAVWISANRLAFNSVETRGPDRHAPGRRNAHSALSRSDFGDSLSRFPVEKRGELVCCRCGGLTPPPGCGDYRDRQENGNRQNEVASFMLPPSRSYGREHPQLFRQGQSRDSCAGRAEIG